MNKLALVSKTMTSTELMNVLVDDNGCYKYTKSIINQKIKEMFQDKTDDQKILPSLDARGYVDEYHLPETESIMFVAK